jgi:dienelactone hydrolase
MRLRASRLSKSVAQAMVCGVFVAGGSANGETNGPQSYETTFYPSGKFKIEAYVYKPEGTGPFPVVIYNHGSREGHEREERPFVYVGNMLVHSGYVAIVPERRGYGKSDGPTFGEAIGEDRGPRFVARVREETDDVLSVVEFVKALPYADTKRMAVMGWSIGGIVSVFAASRSCIPRSRPGMREGLPPGI